MQNNLILYVSINSEWNRLQLAPFVNKDWGRDKMATIF